MCILQGANANQSLHSAGQSNHPKFLKVLLKPLNLFLTDLQLQSPSSNLPEKRNLFENIPKKAFTNYQYTITPWVQPICKPIKCLAVENKNFAYFSIKSLHSVSMMIANFIIKIIFFSFIKQNFLSGKYPQYLFILIFIISIELFYQLSTQLLLWNNTGSRTPAVTLAVVPVQAVTAI